MITKEEIYQRFFQYEWNDVSDSLKQSILNAMEEYAKQFNPNRIDEERFKEIYTRVAPMKAVVEEYNSTLPEIKQLEPLPSEMPKEFKCFCNYTTRNEVWKKLFTIYGTPKREELPSVEKLAEEILALLIVNDDNSLHEQSKGFATYLVDKYSLPKREWWMDLKEGEKFICDGETHTFSGVIFLDAERDLICNVQNCTPYVEPNTREKLLATMTDEQKELLKQWEAERC